MKTEQEKPKRKLNLAVKTLETRIAPGNCTLGPCTQSDVVSGEWTDPHQGAAGGDAGRGAGVPVIGIN